MVQETLEEEKSEGVWSWVGGRGIERERANARGGDKVREREKGRTYVEREREKVREREKGCTYVERERAREHLAPPFIYFLPPGPSLFKLGLVKSAVLPAVLTLVLGPSYDLLLFYFHRLFPSLSFSHCHFGRFFPVLPT